MNNEILERQRIYKHVHTNKYIEHRSQQQQAWGKDMYEYAHIQTVAKDFSRRREQEISTSRTFVRLNALDYKVERWSHQWAVVIQTALC